MQNELIRTTSRSEIVEQHIPCDAPGCGSSDGKCIWSDGHGYCFSCNTYFPSKDQMEEFTYEYLPWRGVSKETMKLYGTKTKIDAEGKPVSIGFEYPNGSYKVRQFAKKAFHSVGDIKNAGLFGRNRFSAGSHRSITITEGELDAQSLYQIIRSPVVSVHSSSSAKLDCAFDRSYLNSFERIYLAFDGDRAGRDAAAQVASLFDYNKVYDVKFTKHKDANEYLRAEEELELKNIWNNAKKFLPDWVISSNLDFERILEEELQQGIPYPFPTLNFMTYGIRKGESVLITAQEGVGKTEMMHAIEHQILRETNDNVGAIFLEEPKKRHLQALAGIEVRKPLHLPDCVQEPSEVYSNLTRLLRRDDRLHIYSHFGSDDPEILLDTIRFLVSARGCSYLLFDHIGMAISGLGGEDERRALDYLSTRLEMMVKELNFALIFVSHVNDNGQTRGSRYIAKIADIRIDLERDLTSSDPVIRSTTSLTVSKNRFSGRTGPAGKLRFDPLTYTLSEDFIHDAENSLIAANDNHDWRTTPMVA